MIVSVHQPQYLPWLGFFDKIARSDCFVFLDTVQYKEREFQNRNKIRTADGWMWLTV
ncbi:MAG: WbqC family protein, partial [Candidatus Omnitrophica bacterium]|nr:WbqC family protein [Candidatus Omnitrophota bacterium]